MRPAACPDCDHPHLIFWGKRPRFAADRNKSHRVFVRRVYCRGCGKTHTVLPAFLPANQAYLVDTVLLVLISVFVDGKGSGKVAKQLSIARSTVRRWVLKFKASAAHHYRRLLFLKHSLMPHAPSPSAAGYPRAALSLFAELFGPKIGGPKIFGRWVSLTTGARLLFYQPSMAP